MVLQTENDCKDVTEQDPLLKIIPYLVTLIVLIFTSRYSAGPKAAGEPYDAGKR